MLVHVHSYMYELTTVTASGKFVKANYCLFTLKLKHTLGICTLPLLISLLYRNKMKELSKQTTIIGIVLEFQQCEQL